MKQLILTITLLSLVTLFSCNKKELEENNQFIVGTWVANFETITGCLDPDMDIQHEVSCTDTYCIEFTFDGDGVYTANILTEDGQLGEQGTYTLNVDDISLCQEDEGEIFCKGGSYDISPTSLTFTTTDTDSECMTTWTFEKVDGSN